MDLGRQTAAAAAPNVVISDASFCKLFIRFLGVYWKTFIIVLWPVILLPILFINGDNDIDRDKKSYAKYKTLYVVLMMSGYWITESLPLAITGLIPVVMCPLMGILKTEKTCQAYFSETAFMFLGSLIVAFTIENSGLHLRVALFIVKGIGCSHRRLTLGLFFVTMFMSMWVANTAATAMMIPIIETVLTQLEQQGLGAMYTEETEDSPKRPSKTVLAYYLGTAYAASIGGVGTIVGSGTNLIMKGQYESLFPRAPNVDFFSWMFVAIPVVTISGFLTWMWLQVLYMGMFRPHSADARAINIGAEGESFATSVVKQRYKELGPLTWHEFIVAVLFLTVVTLWFFRDPGFTKGWPEYLMDITGTEINVQDSAASIAFSIMAFVLPANLSFLRSFSKDPAKRPTRGSPGLIGWPMIHDRMHWSLLMVLGGGFAIARASIETQLSDMIGHSFAGLKTLPPFVILLLVLTAMQIITELTANVAIGSVMIPIIANMCVAVEIHPLYLMMPVALTCSFSFHLPSSTPPNAIVYAAGHIHSLDFLKAGFGPSIITLVVLSFVSHIWGSYVFDLYQFPEWARNATVAADAE